MVGRPLSGPGCQASPGATFRVSALRVSIPVAALLLAGCAQPVTDSRVDAETDDQIRAIAAGDNLDSRFARIILADGHATVREVKTWLAESDAAQGIEARSDETPQAAQPEGRKPGAEGMRP